MKVGYLLNEVMKDIPSLKYPIKIVNICNENKKINKQKRLEANILIGKCNYFINEINKSKSKLNISSLNSTIRKSESLSIKNTKFLDNSYESETLRKKPIKKKSKFLPRIKNNSSVDNYKDKKIFLSNRLTFNLVEENQIHKLFNLRFERKHKLMNKIIDKLNKPLFLVNKTDYNN